MASFVVHVVNYGNPLWQETLRQRLKLLTEERSDLQSQLMDCQLRIEQEGKVWVTAVPVYRAALERFCVEGHNVGWSSFIISQTSSFTYFSR